MLASVIEIVNTKYILIGIGLLIFWAIGFVINVCLSTKGS